MDTEAPGDGEPADHKEESSLESILEALLVEDADIVWDPKSGSPRVTRRPKPKAETGA